MTNESLFYLLNETFRRKRWTSARASKTGDVLLFGDWSPCWRNWCFKKLLVCDYDAYQRFVDSFPEGDAKRKFAGLMRFGEIVIDSSHVNLLAKAMDENKANFTPEHQEWVEILMDTLASIQREPVMYIMVKRHDE